MRAATVMSFGGPEVFEIVEHEPLVLGEGEVVVAVAAADTLWLETQVRAGLRQDYWPMRPPYVPGDGVAGRVTAVGAGADPGLVGRAVVAHTGNEGGYASEAVVPASALSLVPAGVGPDVAVALSHDAVTALRLYDVTGIGDGDHVVVVGASGGLGVCLVQLARSTGAHVVALARGPKLDRVRALGPDEFGDTDDPDWVERVRDLLPAAGADVVLDNIGGDLGAASFALVADGARFSGHGTPGGRFTQVDPARRRGVTVTGIESVQLDDRDLVRHTDRALDLAVQGTLAPVIGQRFSLEDAAAAHAAIEGRAVFGKTLLEIG